MRKDSGPPPGTAIFATGLCPHTMAFSSHLIVQAHHSVMEAEDDRPSCYPCPDLPFANGEAAVGAVKARGWRVIDIGDLWPWRALGMKTQTSHGIVFNLEK